MFANVTFHEVIAGAALLLLIAVVAALSIMSKAIPTDLWTLLSAFAAYSVGVQIPSGSEQAKVATLEAKVASLPPAA